MRRWLLRVFLMGGASERVPGIVLKISECEFIWYGIETPLEVVQSISSSAPQMPTIKVTHASRFLGVQLGPMNADVFWNFVLNEFRSRVQCLAVEDIGRMKTLLT